MGLMVEEVLSGFFLFPFSSSFIVRVDVGKVSGFFLGWGNWEDRGFLGNGRFALGNGFLFLSV